MAGTQTEAVLNEISKSELVQLLLAQLLLNTKANMGTHITMLTAEIKKFNSHLKKLEADVGVTKNVNSRLVDQLVGIEWQCWANAKYSQLECLEVVGITSSVKDDALEDVLNVSREIDVEIGQRDIQTCQRVKNNQTVVKFSNRKDYLQILRVKKQFKDFDCALSNFPAGTKIFVDESFCPFETKIFFHCGTNAKQSGIKINFTNFTL